MLHCREAGDGERVAVLIHGMAGDGDDWAPVVRLVRADPSLYVTVDIVDDLVARGFTVRSVPGTTHNVWYDGHEHDFLATLDGWVDAAR